MSGIGYHKSSCKEPFRCGKRIQCRAENKTDVVMVQKTKDGAGSISVCAIRGFLCVVELYGLVIN